MYPHNSESWAQIGEGVCYEGAETRDDNTDENLGLSEENDEAGSA
ncbi:uncharacterized protein RSE6_13519 [Rhynchosporium secalis]|uniref:Uncharacterized protein n=1 Tax=Rhynchosporium secalis TaxID=38038 RepID=A0A1E1MT22_RHYSE|nr:uncharacterized protein RSE6_13519 [Rhynchosporium secalis]